jgi:hypothetical protein
MKSQSQEPKQNKVQSLEAPKKVKRIILNSQTNIQMSILIKKISPILFSYLDKKDLLNIYDSSLLPNN